MIERPPHFADAELLRVAMEMLLMPDEKIDALVDKINEGYEYWDTVKYKKLPEGCSARDLWVKVKSARMKKYVKVWSKYRVMFALTDAMQRMCQHFDMNFGGMWERDSLVTDENKKSYLVGSLMEEAIYSSLMEGAATTRKVAKDMLRKKMTPKDKSQQMISNNYQTIQFIVENKDTALTPDLLRHIHMLMTDKTLENPEDAGRFRINNDVVVEDGITHETVHVPPEFTEIPGFVDELCTFFNETSPKVFIHPIIRGIIIHFMISYMHPFVDGNGRTARAMFYWYMLKQGYWLTEYLSISRVIARSKKAYEKSFLYAEADGMDIGYFIWYNLKVLDLSFRQLKTYINRKRSEKLTANVFLKIEGINERQAQIIMIYVDNPSEVLTVKDLQVRFGVSPTTAKTDITGLMNRGLLSEISFNKVKKGYVKGERFDDIVNKL